MCLAEVTEVIELGGETAIVQRPNGKRQRVSLLALEGDRPVVGDQLAVLSGIALHRLERESSR